MLPSAENHSFPLQYVSVFRLACLLSVCLWCWVCMWKFSRLVDRYKHFDWNYCVRLQGVFVGNIMHGVGPQRKQFKNIVYQDYPSNVSPWLRLQSKITCSLDLHCVRLLQSYFQSRLYLNSLNNKKSDSCKQIFCKTLQKVDFFWGVTPCILVKFTGVLKGRTTPVLTVEGRRYFRETSVNISTAIRRLT
jgi:hypothetical protein